jgi:DnaJ-class molecular chaperone
LSDDPYKALGVGREASQAEVQKAYRRLAKKLHPDINPGNSQAEAQFKVIAAAYDVLGDAAKRKRFDAGEIDAQGTEQPRQRAYRDYAESGANPYASGAGYSDFEGADDLFSELFGRGSARRDGAFKRRGEDAAYRLAIDFLDAVNGAKTQITLPDGSTLEVSIPPGIREGQILRMRGKGRAGHGGGPTGDALVEVRVRAHPLFTRRGDDILVDQPISLVDAVLGGKISVPTPTGLVQMTAPKWTNTGAVLRLKGKGVLGKAGVRGDQYVTLRLTLPEAPDADLEQLLSQWASAAVDRKPATAET